MTTRFENASKEEREKRERRDVQTMRVLADNSLCDFMLNGSEGEEKLSDGRRRERWLAASSKEQLPLSFSSQRGLFDPQNPK